jgi:hypothetical protein
MIKNFVGLIFDCTFSKTAALGAGEQMPGRHDRDHGALALTTTGRRALKRINNAADHDHPYLLGLFPEHDVDTLSVLLARFTASMKQLHNGAVNVAGPPPKVPTTGDG